MYTSAGMDLKTQLAINMANATYDKRRHNAEDCPLTAEEMKRDTSRISEFATKRIQIIVHSLGGVLNDAFLGYYQQNNETIPELKKLNERLVSMIQDVNSILLSDAEAFMKVSKVNQDNMRQANDMTCGVLDEFENLKAVLLNRIKASGVSEVRKYEESHNPEDFTTAVQAYAKKLEEDIELLRQKLDTASQADGETARLAEELTESRRRGDGLMVQLRESEDSRYETEKEVEKLIGIERRYSRLQAEMKQLHQERNNSRFERDETRQKLKDVEQEKGRQEEKLRKLTENLEQQRGFKKELNDLQASYRRLQTTETILKDELKKAQAQYQTQSKSYQELKEKLKKLQAEKSAADCEVTRLESLTGEQEAKVQTLKGKLEAQREDLQTKLNDLSEYRMKTVSLKENKNKLHDQNKQLREQLSRLKSELEEQVKHLSGESSQKTTVNQSLKIELEQRLTDLQVLKTKLQTLGQKEEKLKEVERELLRSQERCTQAVRESERLKSQLTSLKKHHAESETERDRFSREVVEARRQVSQVRELLSKQEASLLQAQAKAEATAKDLNDEKEKFSNHEFKHWEVWASFNKTRRVLREVTTQRDKLQEDKEALEAFSAKLEGDAEKSAIKIKSREEQLSQIKSELSRAVQELTDKKERLTNVSQLVDELRQDKVRLEAQLKLQSEKGSSQKSSQEALKSQLAVLEEQLEQASFRMKRAAEEYEAKLCAAKNESSEMELKNGLLMQQKTSLEMKERKARESAQDLSEKLASITRQLNEGRSEIATLEYELERTRADKDQLTEKLREQSKQLKGSKAMASELDDLKKQLAARNSELENYQFRVDELNQQKMAVVASNELALAELKDELAVDPAKLRELEEQLVEQKITVANLESERNELMTELANAQAQFIKMYAESSEASDNEVVTRECELVAELEKLRKEKQVIEAGCNSAEENFRKSQIANEDLKDRNNSLTIQLSDLKKESRIANESQARFESEAYSLRRQLDDQKALLSQAANDKKVMREQFDNDIRAVEDMNSKEQRLNVDLKRKLNHAEERLQDMEAAMAEEVATNRKAIAEFQAREEVLMTAFAEVQEKLGDEDRQVILRRLAEISASRK